MLLQSNGTIKNMKSVILSTFMTYTDHNKINMSLLESVP